MTRMWMCDPMTMCRQHLLGEHKELHQLIGQLRKRLSITGYVVNNCIEVKSLYARHEALVAEMISRGYNHQSPMISQAEIDILSAYLPDDEREYRVDVVSSNEDRFKRCSGCCHLGKINWRGLP